jgi:hypothetical protein
MADKNIAADKIVFDIKNITGVQLLTEDFRNMNIEPVDIQYLEVHDHIPNISKRNPSENDYEVSYVKICIKNAKTKLKLPGDFGEEDTSPEAAEKAYNNLMLSNVYGISIEQNNEWKSYYFSPENWIENDNGDFINTRVQIEQEGEYTAIIVK